MGMDNEYFMNRALEEAKIALADGEFPVGCVIAWRDRIVATGMRKFSKGAFLNEIDHAEMVALKYLSRQEQVVDSSKAALYCTMEPCLMCLGAIILSGIRKVVFAYEDVMGGATNCDLTKLSQLYKKEPITIVGNVLRAESLALFQTYFSDPNNTYWQDSLLARYTLSQ
jgi:tRNA(adenine34) deaminase